MHMGKRIQASAAVQHPSAEAGRKSVELLTKYRAALGSDGPRISCSSCGTKVPSNLLLCPYCEEFVSPLDDDCPFGVLDDRPFLNAVAWSVIVIALLGAAVLIY